MVFCGIFANVRTVVLARKIRRTISCEHFSTRTFPEHVEHLLSSVVVRILCSLCTILHLFLETVRTWSLSRQRPASEQPTSQLVRLLLVEGHPRQAPATPWFTSGAPRGRLAPGLQPASRGDPAFHLLLATEAAEVPHGWWRTLRGLSQPISMVPCAKIRTNGVYDFLSFQRTYPKVVKSLCLRSSSAITCAFSSVRAHRLSLAPRVDTPSPLDGSQFLSLCDFLVGSRKPSCCPILPWFVASSSRHSVNFITRQVLSKFVDVWHENFHCFL